MKTFNKLLVILLIVSMSLSMLVACTDPDGNTPEGENNLAPWVDYVSEVKLDRNSGTLQIEATVKRKRCVE